MKNKRIIYWILITVFITIGMLVFIGIRHFSIIKADNFINNNDYYEAYKYINEKNLFITDHNNNSSVKFFDVMARHYKAEIIGEGTWVLPDMTGWSCAEIAYALHNIGQSYEIEYIEDESYNANAVIAHYPQCGQEVSKNDKITLEVNNYTVIDNIYSRIKLNYNQICEIGEWIYSIRDNSIYRSRIDGADSTKIYENVDEHSNIISIFGKSDYIYCIIAGDSPNKNITIKSISQKDYSIKKLVQAPLTLNLRMYGSKIYLFNKDVYILDVETEIMEKLFDNNLEFIISKGYMYYLEEKGHVLKRVNMDDGTSSELISVSGEVKSFFVNNNNIFLLINERNEDDGSYSECLIQHDLEKNITKEIACLENNTSYFGEYILNTWRDCVLLTGYSGNTIIININNGERTIIKTLDYINSQLLVSELTTVCGNYLCYNILDEKILKQDTYPYRYNLMTGEKEEFIISD